MTVNEAKGDGGAVSASNGATTPSSNRSVKETRLLLFLPSPPRPSLPSSPGRTSPSGSASSSKKKRRGSHEEATGSTAKRSSDVAAPRGAKVPETKAIRVGETGVEREQALLKRVGPSVLTELPAHMNVRERIALLENIATWEDEPLGIEDARVSDTDISAAEMRQWQRLVRTYLRPLSDEQLRDLVFNTPDVLKDVTQVYDTNYRASMSMSMSKAHVSSHPALPLVRHTLSARELLVMLTLMGETRTNTRAYLLARHPEIPAPSFASPLRVQLPPAPTSLEEVFGAPPMGSLRLPKDGPVQRAAIAYLAGVWIKTPHQYAKAPARIVTQLGAVIDAATTRTLVPRAAPTAPNGDAIATEARVYARYTLHMPLNAPERILSRALWQFERERESAYNLELEVWEAWLRPGTPVSVLVEWQAQHGYGPHKLRYAGSMAYYEPLRARDPVVTLSSWSRDVRVVVQAHVQFYATAGPNGPAVTVRIDDDQFPWLAGRRPPTEQQRTLELRVAPRDWCGGDPDASESKTTYRLAEGGAIRWRTEEFALDVMFNQPKGDYRSEMACLQPPDDMIAGLVLAYGHRGQRLRLGRRIRGDFVAHLNPYKMAPMYVEARVIEAGVHPISSTRSRPTPYLRVWVDGHVVELHVRHHSAGDSCRSCVLDVLDGHRWESLGPDPHPRFGGSSVYSIFYDTPIAPSVRAYIERVQEAIPPPLRGVRDLTDLVTQMLHY